MRIRAPVFDRMGLPRSCGRSRPVPIEMAERDAPGPDLVRVIRRIALEDISGAFDRLAGGEPVRQVIVG
jgi:Zn-dependent alcohol dehydrogenase